MARKVYGYEYLFSGISQARLNPVLEEEVQRMLEFRPLISKQCKVTTAEDVTTYRFDTWEITFWKVDMRVASEAPYVNIRKGLRINLIKGRIIFG